MKNLILLIISLLYVGTCLAQTINFTEYDSDPKLIDSRNGTLALGDIDNDGDADLLVLGEDSNNTPKTTLYRNDGTGLFTEIVGTPFENLRIGSIDFADVDNDGDLDVLISGSNNAPAYFTNLYLNDGTGNFTLDTTTPFPGQSGFCAFADVDGDDDLDFLMVGGVINASFSLIPHTALYLNDGSGGFTEDTGTALEDMMAGPFEFIDIDNDGDQDVIIAGEDINEVKKNQIYANDGNGNFSLVATNAFVVFDFGDIAVGDSDNDGDQDVLINGRDEATGNRATRLYTNDGSGNFTELTGTPFTPSDLGDLIFADFDNDGDQDILITGDIPGNFIHAADIYENQGANNFVLAQELTGGYLASADVGDMNGDNLLDIAISSIAQEANSDIFKPRTYLNQTNITASVDLLLEPALMTLFPNPTAGYFQIQGVTGDYTIQILDSTGAVYQTLSSPVGTISVDISTLPTGLYFISAINDSNALMSIQKILKQ